VRDPDTEGRDVRSQVIADDDRSIAIVVLVEPPHGGHDCPSNPAFPYGVELPSPLGDRMILDAGLDPPAQRLWPPTATSLDSFGQAE
jgi:hypothetical protein